MLHAVLDLCQWRPSEALLIPMSILRDVASIHSNTQNPIVNAHLRKGRWFLHNLVSALLHVFDLTQQQSMCAYVVVLNFVCLSRWLRTQSAGSVQAH